MTEKSAASKQFPAQHVLAHMKKHHPQCPEAIMAEIVRTVAERPWTRKTRMGQAVGIAAHNYVRHQMTGYKNLYRIQGLTRKEAHFIILPEVMDIIRSWKAQPAVPGPPVAAE